MKRNNYKTIAFGLLVWLCFTNAVIANCQGTEKMYADLITNVNARKTTLLNGQWRTIIDAFENGYYNYRYEPHKDGGYAANRKPKDKSELIEYSFDNGQLLNVPGDWNTQDDQLLFYEGTIWYKRDFDYNPAPNKRLFVHFGAANYDAKVWLNGKWLGEHKGGFTPFQFEITDLVKDTGNFMVAKVDNQRKHEAVPTVNFDWWNYGGITRDVLLVEVPETFIKDYFIQLDPAKPDHIVGWVQLDGSNEAKQILTVQLPELNVSKNIKTDEHGLAAFSFKVDELERWSPEHPKRYQVVVKSKSDSIAEQIGFRTIETRGTEILLNGKPIFLRGVCMHEEAPFRAGRAFNEADGLTLLGWAKELNANFVRLAHYPHGEYMTKLADSLGLLLWTEIPVYWTIQWKNEATFSLAEQMLREMITRDKNRASVMLWSIGNETPLSQDRLHFMRRLAGTARSLDATRLITAALERHYENDTTLMINDPLGKYLDVLGVNEYIGWYDGMPPKADNISWKTIYDKPLIMSEFGGSALQGYHGKEDIRWTEEFQQDIYEHQIPMLKKIPFLAGTTPWMLMDVRSPRRTLPGIQDFYNRKGLISDQGMKKQAFFVLRRWYEEIKNNVKQDSSQLHQKTKQ